MELKFRKDEKKVLGSGDWDVRNEEAGTTIWTGIWDGDKVVALLVAADADAFQQTIDYYGDAIVRAVNSHNALVKALQCIVNDLAENDEEGLIEHTEPMIQARAALALAGEKP